MAGVVEDEAVRIGGEAGHLAVQPGAFRLRIEQGAAQVDVDHLAGLLDRPGVGRLERLDLLPDGGEPPGEDAAAASPAAGRRCGGGHATLRQQRLLRFVDELRSGKGFVRAADAQVCRHSFSQAASRSRARARGSAAGWRARALPRRHGGRRAGAPARPPIRAHARCRPRTTARSSRRRGRGDAARWPQTCGGDPLPPGRPGECRPSAR